MPLDKTKIAAGVTLVLQGLDVDLRDSNYHGTPQRVADAYEEMFGLKQNQWATFPESYTEFVMCRGHKMWTLCPHHMFPVELEVSLAYIPNGHVLGLSKFVRILDEINTQPLLQEALTTLAIEKMKEVCPDVRGVACYVRGLHDCMRIRGVKSSSETITYKLEGEFKEQPELEERFFRLVAR